MDAIDSAKQKNTKKTGLTNNVPGKTNLNKKSNGRKYISITERRRNIFENKMRNSSTGKLLMLSMGRFI